MKKQAVIFVGILFLILFIGAIGQNPVPTGGTPPVPGTSASPSVRANADFGRVPLYFIPNQGQLDGRVAFSIQGRDKTVYFSPGGLTFLLREREAERAGNKGIDSAKGFSNRKDSTSSNWVVKLDFVNANGDVKPVGEEKTGGVVSYFKGKPEDWKAGLPTYSRIIYRDLWPGIDLAYSGTVNRLKYEFIVHPGADPSQVRLAYRGVDGISVDQEGRLEVKTPAGGFKDDVPVAYQEFAGEKRFVALKYKMDVQDRDSSGESSEQLIWSQSCSYKFEVGDYDPAQTLILDPALFIFAGYIGGMSNDVGAGIAVDASGNVYVTGYTQSDQTYFPETVGPDLTYNGDYDAFIAKVNASGASLAYCGYIGGDQDDRGLAVAVDSLGNAYVTGYASSTQTTFPVLAGYDLTHNGLKDAFVAKVSTAGALVYCTYLGGSADDVGSGIAVDGSNNAYVTGYTASTEVSFPEITGPDLSYNGGSWDAFVCKLNSSGNGRYYCGYIGGSDNDLGYGVAVDSLGNAYLTGTTDSNESTFPVAVGPDLTYWNYGEAFVAKVNPSGTTLTYCGYIAGSGIDNGYGIAVDAKGSAYVTGDTQGALPTVVGPDLTYNGYPDAFVAKVTPAGNALDYCGYIGGTSVDRGHGIAVDPSGNAFIVGYTNSNETSHGFPVVGGPDLINDGGDGFVARLDASGAKLMYCGYIGGGGTEEGRAVAVDSWGNAYATGYTNSPNFPTIIGPDLTYNGYEGYDTDGFVAKVYSYRVPARTLAVGDVDGDGTKELAVDLGASGAWLYDTGSWTQLSTMNPEGMMAANVDADAVDELLLDFGYAGLWLWNGGVMDLLSEENVETMAAGDLDADGTKELAVDFGPIGLWLYDGGAWNQLSGVNVELLAVDQLNGSGGAELVGDFGTVGLWELSGGSWTQLSGVNLQSMATANTDGTDGRELIGDFGPIGLWLLSGGVWTQWSGVNADQMSAADIDGSGDDEVFGDFALTGLWLWDSGSWTILSGLNVDDMVAADSDGDGADEMVADFAATGIWHWDTGSWNQISAVNPENMTAGDFDGDNAEEVAADFGSLGLWLWNGGVWSQISANNPD